MKGDVLIALPSIEVLAEAAAVANRRGAVMHVLESTVVGWMKQIKVNKTFDPFDYKHSYHCDNIVYVIP